MNPFLLMKTSTSLKKELWLIATLVAALICLPFISVLSLTNIAGAASSSTSGSISVINGGVYDANSYPGDTYAWGNCTWWVFILRSQIGEPVPTTWGNATTWASRAAADGYLVDHTPSYGAIMQTPNVDSGLGHVAFVESVNPANGDWTVSEMNVEGLDVVDYRTYPPLAVSEFNFIHTLE
jgi:surface antigen